MKKPEVIFSHIVAVSQNQVIGTRNRLPWHVPGDLKFFHNTTRGKALIMGRKTFESLKQPLRRRLNVVVTRDRDFKPEVHTRWSCLNDHDPLNLKINNALTVTQKALSVVVCFSLKEAMDFCSRKEVLRRHGKEIFIIGGSEIYRQTLPLVYRIYLTRIYREYEGDAFYPEIPKEEFQEVSRKDTSDPISHSFLVYERRGRGPAEA